MIRTLKSFGWKSKCFKMQEDVFPGISARCHKTSCSASFQCPFRALIDDTRTCMGLPLLSSIMDVRTGLARNGWTSATFKHPRQLLERFDLAMY